MRSFLSLKQAENHYSAKRYISIHNKCPKPYLYKETLWSKWVYVAGYYRFLPVFVCLE